MPQTRQELEPKVAAGLALDALLEASRYSGRGLTTWGTRAGRRAAVAGLEGARRTGGAWAVLRGVPAPSPARRHPVVLVLLGVTAGVATTLAVRQAVQVWRASGPGRETDSEPQPAVPESATSIPG
jgi:hypothetical protein